MEIVIFFGNLKTKLEFCHFQFNNIENCLGMSLLNVSCHSTFIPPGWAGYTKGGLISDGILTLVPLLRKGAKSREIRLFLLRDQSQNTF